MSQLLTIREVAHQLNVSEITIKRYLHNNLIQSFKIGGLRKIAQADLDIFLKSQTNIPRPSKRGFELSYPGKVNEQEIINSPPNLRLAIKNPVLSKNSNRLFIGDNFEILKILCQDRNTKGKVDLIYIDPPFGTGQNFVGYDENQSYSDKLVNFEFLEFIRKRLILLRELLSPTGSIYLHIDNKIGHYIKIIMDEVFGDSNFRNDITRIKCNPKNFERKAFGNIKDVIYFYSKSEPKLNNLKWTDFREPLSQSEIEKQFPKIDKEGRRYATTPLHAKGETKNGPTGKTWKGLKPPKGRHWRYNPKELTKLDELGMIEWSSTGNPRKIIYAHETKGKKIQDIWDFKDPGYENAKYPTEKNIDLLKRIILSSSQKNDLVLDCFSGSGTTIIAAETLDRKWIGIDSNENAIKLTIKRLNEMKSYDHTLYYAE